MILVAPCISQKQFAVNAQNSVSGNVYGINRRPMAGIFVELQDEYRRLIRRTQTNGSGYYEFRGFREGTLFIHVITLGTEYEEEEQELMIQNVTIDLGNGRSQTSGFDNAQKDIYLRLRRGIDPASVAIFVQEVPPKAEKLFKKAIEDLDGKRREEGLAELRAAIELFPQYFDALERLGTEYVGMGGTETMQAAAILLDSAVQINPRSFKGWYGLAYAHYSLGNQKAAAAAIEKAIVISPNSPDALLLSGALMLQAKNYAEAEKRLVKARDNAKNTLPQIHRELGLLYGMYLKKYADAAKELKLYLKAKPDAKDADDLKKRIADFESKAKEA